MTTYTALTTLPGKDAAEALALGLERLIPEPIGVGIFEIEDGSGLWEVGGYFEAPPDQAGLALLAVLHGAKAFVISALPEVDWVAHVRRELVPIEAGRFFIYGSHDADKVPPGAHPLLIEASMAFGTGHHGTTLGCLRAFDQLLSEGFSANSVLDLGCGTAVLAMAAARAGQGKTAILASDIDQVAVEVAQVNVAANGLQDRVRCIESEGFENPILGRSAPYDLIFANILKGPLIRLAPAMNSHLAPGGMLILSGILNAQSDEIITNYTQIGNSLRCKIEIGEWTTTVIHKSIK